jgi:hypothetical protein
MSLSKTGTCAVYAFKTDGAFTKKDNEIRLMGWHMGPEDEAEITLHGKLDCYVNGQLVQGNGSVVYKIQPDGSYTGEEHLRPRLCSMEAHGLVMPAPALGAPGALLLTIQPNAGCKGVLKVRVKGDEDDWAGFPKKRGSPDRDLAKEYDQAARREYAVELKEAGGSVKIFQMPRVQDDACDQWGGLYPASGDCYDVAFRLLGLLPGDCAPALPTVELQAADLPASGTEVTSLLGGKIVLAATASGGVLGAGGAPVFKIVDSVSAPSGKGVALHDNNAVLGGAWTVNTGSMYFNTPGIVSWITNFEIECTLLSLPASSPNIPTEDYREIQCFVPYFNGTSWVCASIVYNTTITNWYILTDSGATDTGIPASQNLAIKAVQTDTEFKLWLNTVLKVTENTASAPPPRPVDYDVIQYRSVIAWNADPGIVVRSYDEILDANIKFSVVTGA